MKLPDELDTGGKWELVFHRLQIAEEDPGIRNIPENDGETDRAGRRNPSFQ